MAKKMNCYQMKIINAHTRTVAKYATVKNLLAEVSKKLPGAVHLWGICGADLPIIYLCVSD